MAKRRKRIKWNRVIVALILVFAVLFGIYKGISYLFNAIDFGTIFSKEDPKNYIATVVVDPGHGGADVGASFNELVEKDINLKVSQSIYTYLEENNIKVILTRKDDLALNEDKNKDLIKRAEYSDIYHADLFVSIHVNDYENDSSVSGFEIHYKDEESQSLAKNISSQLESLNITNNRGLFENQGLMVLRRNSVNSVIVELGYIKSTDSEYLSNDEKLVEIANAIGLGIKNELSK